VTARPKLLIVEDDKTASTMMARQLKRYAVTVASSGRDCMQAFEHEPPDLVLLDFQLPDATGAYLVGQLRGRRPSVPIILMSGAIDVQESAEAMAYGADDFIAKPFLREAIETKVDRQLAASALRRTIARQEAEVRELQARREEEAAAARSVLDRMISRGDYDPSWIRHEVIAHGGFAGDVVFAVSLGNGRFRWMVGDVTGHTLASALVTIPLSMIFYATARRAAPLPEVLALFERELGGMLPTHMFCAAAIFDCDRTTGRLSVWNGGLPDIAIRRASGAVTTIPSQAPPLAADRYVTSHEVLELDVATGDRIYAVSDGVIEASNEAGEFLGMPAVLAELAAPSPETAFDRIVSQWRRHSEKPQDDASFIEVTV